MNLKKQLLIALGVIALTGAGLFGMRKGMTPKPKFPSKARIQRILQNIERSKEYIALKELSEMRNPQRKDVVLAIAYRTFLSNKFNDQIYNFPWKKDSKGTIVIPIKHKVYKLLKNIENFRINTLARWDNTKRPGKFVEKNIDTVKVSKKVDLSKALEHLTNMEKAEIYLYESSEQIYLQDNAKNINITFVDLANHMIQIQNQFTKKKLYTLAKKLTGEYYSALGDLQPSQTPYRYRMQMPGKRYTDIMNWMKNYEKRTGIKPTPVKKEVEKKEEVVEIVEQKKDVDPEPEKKIVEVEEEEKLEFTVIEAPEKDEPRVQKGIAKKEEWQKLLERAQATASEIEEEEEIEIVEREKDVDEPEPGEKFENEVEVFVNKANHIYANQFEKMETKQTTKTLEAMLKIIETILTDAKSLEVKGLKLHITINSLPNYADFIEIMNKHIVNIKNAITAAQEEEAEKAEEEERKKVRIKELEKEAGMKEEEEPTSELQEKIFHIQKSIDELKNARNSIFLYSGFVLLSKSIKATADIPKDKYRNLLQYLLQKFRDKLGNLKIDVKTLKGEVLNEYNSIINELQEYEAKKLEEKKGMKL